MDIVLLPQMVGAAAIVLEILTANLAEDPPLGVLGFEMHPEGSLVGESTRAPRAFVRNGRGRAA